MDALGCSAELIAGASPRVQAGGGMEYEGGSCALSWFRDVYPSLGARERPLEFVQRPGETVVLDLLRDGEERHIKVTLGERPDRDALERGAMPRR